MSRLRYWPGGFHEWCSISSPGPLSPGGLLMKLVRLVTACVAVTLLFRVSIGYQVAAGDADEPDLVITPNTIRIQSLDDPTKGQWVTMPGFSELGSPTFSRDGRWIAFDAYKEGFNNSSAECWIARRD